MKVAVVGSRGWTNREQVRRELFKLLRLVGGYTRRKEIEIVSGGAQGPDTIAVEWAHSGGMPFRIIRPDWDKYGKGAGMLRNAEIVANADMVLAFWDGESKGTADTIKKSLAAKKELHVFFPDKPFPNSLSAMEGV